MEKKALDRQEWVFVSKEVKIKLKGYSSKKEEPKKPTFTLT